MRRTDTRRQALLSRTAAALGAAALLAASPATRAQDPGEFSAASTDPEGRESGFSAIALRTQALRLAIEYPERGQEIAAPDGRGFITGTAYQTRTRSPGEYDVFVAIDVSASTRRPAGADVDGDGRVGSEAAARSIPLLGMLLAPVSSDPGDSVLAAEIKAAKTLLAQLDPLNTRVGVIAFSGTRDARRASQPDARIAVPLTRDYDEVAARLDELVQAGPMAETNLLAAVQLASVEFERDVLAKRQRRVQRLLLLISDGRATLPAALSPRERISATIEAARDAASIFARIDTYAVGRDDPEALATLRGIAEATQGSFERVAQPADLVARFQALDLAQLQQLSVRNLTTSEQSDNVLIDAYGAFSAIVPLREGSNELEVFARARSGSEDRERFTVVYRRQPGLPVLPVRALERRARLLEERVREAYLEDMERARARRERARSIEVKPE
jgi:hypothetical protein